MNNMVLNFISNSRENKELLYNGWYRRCDEDLKKVEKMFSDYLLGIYLCSYIKKTITYSSMEYKKKQGIIRFHEDLSLNIVPEGYEEEKINTIPDKEVDFNEIPGDSTDLQSLIGSSKLLESINYLTDNQKGVIYMRYVLELSEVQIAQKLGISVQAVNKTKNTAVNKIRQYMEVR